MCIRDRYLTEEHKLFEWGIQRELKEVLERNVQGHVDMYTRGIDTFDALLKKLEDPEAESESAASAGESAD